MKKNNAAYLWPLFFLPLVSLVFSGCQMTSLFSSPIQKRGVSGFFKDNILRAKIEKNLFLQYKGSVSLLISGGRVMVVGSVKSAQDMKKIGDTLRDIKEVTTIFNHLTVAQSADNSLNDTYLSQTLQSKLFFDTRIRSQNYHITAWDKTIYILGTASSAQEKAWVLAHAESMKIRNLVHEILY
jgi:osmotically-inducible protein OsmY